MIQDQFHVCDEVMRFGFTAHGLAVGTQTGAQSLRVDGVEFPLPFVWPFNAGTAVEPYDTHLLKVPGIAPVSLSPEEVAAEKAEGRTWQNYALLSEDRLLLFGQVLNGWVCIDSTGERWLIKGEPEVNRQEFDKSVPLVLNLSAVRFGHLDEAAETPTPLSATLTNVGQSSTYQAPPSATVDPNRLMLTIGSISSDGRKAVLEIRGIYSPALSSTIRANTAPSGFLLLELTGDGPAFVATLSVLRTRQQVLGTYIEQRARPKRCSLDLTWSTTSSPRAGGADVIATATGVTCTEVPEATGVINPLLGSVWLGDERTGRIAALIFDDANNLVEFSYDVIRRCDANYPNFNTTSYSGDVRGWISDGSDYTDTSVTTTVNVSVARTASELVTGSIKLKRNGSEVAGGVFKVERTIQESRTFGVPAGLRRVEGQVIGRPPQASWIGEGSFSYSSVVTVDEGPGQVTWSLMPFSSRVYTDGLWTAFTTSTTPSPYGYGATVDYGNTVSDDYAGARLSLKRFSNNVFGVSVFTKAGLLPSRSRVPSLAAPQANWSNGASQDTNSGRAASYHPLTHELFTAVADGATNFPFVWI